MAEYEVEFQLDGLRSELQADLLDTELFGPKGERHYSAKPNFRLSLSPGIYRARVSGGGMSHDELVVIEPKPGQRVKLKVPERYSSAPMPDAIGHHEYYISTFTDRGLTRGPLNHVDESDTSHLFIYLRMRDQEHARRYTDTNKMPPMLFKGLKLLDQQGNCLTRFADDEVAQIPGIGMARFRAQISPGYYRLVYTDDDGRKEWLPLPVLEPGDYRWDTDISMLWDDRPLMGTMSLFTPESNASSHTDIFEYDMQVNAIDTVIQTLASGQRVRQLKSSTVSQLLSGKFSNPMMGILGLHLYLLGEKSKPGTVDMVLSNLRSLAPHSPDVVALHYLAYKKNLIEPPDRWEFRDIPVVRLGAMAMQRAMLGKPDGADALPPHAEQLFLHLKKGSPWSQTGCAFQPALEEPSAMKFDADALNLAMPVSAAFFDVNTRHTQIVESPLESIVETQFLGENPLRLLGISPADQRRESVVPNWLTETFLKKLPELAEAEQDGSLVAWMQKLAADYEVLLPTVEKLTQRLLDQQAKPFLTQDY